MGVLDGGVCGNHQSDLFGYMYFLDLAFREGLSMILEGCYGPAVYPLLCFTFCGWSDLTFVLNSGRFYQVLCSRGRVIYYDYGVRFSIWMS